MEHRVNVSFQLSFDLLHEAVEGSDLPESSVCGTGALNNMIFYSISKTYSCRVLWYNVC